MRLSLIVSGAMLALLACTTDPADTDAFTVLGPASFDRTFTAAAGAMRDQGLAISVEDPVNGVVIGSLDTMTVMASVHQQADGYVRVEFDSMAAHDPALMVRISRNYNDRMGR